MIGDSLADAIRDQLFLDRHTYDAFQEREVPEVVLRRAYAAARMGPTCLSCNPLRVLLVRSLAAKQRLLSAVWERNRGLVKRAPITAIFGFDLNCGSTLGELGFGQARTSFEGEQTLVSETAFRNGTLQAAYFMLALRSDGLDLCPMSGFDNHRADREFWPEGHVRSNFLCNIGYGDESQIRPSAAVGDFDDVCALL